MVSCPQCGHSTDPNERFCDYCGVNLALAAVLAEREIDTSLASNDGIQISPEILVPRIGSYLIEKGILDEGGLNQALEKQAKSAGKHTPLIGKTLLDLGLVSKEALDQAITEQIIELHSALKNANEGLEKRIRERTIELENALYRLSEINQLKSNFIANVSHELRTPLTHIKGYIELFVEGELGPLEPEQLKALLVMKKSEERLEELIENLIQFSLFVRGDSDIKVENIDLEACLNGILYEIYKKCLSANITFELKIQPNIPHVKADWIKIRWVIEHLVDNAIKFTPEKGHVSLEVFVKDQLVSIAISDSGIGISENKLGEIFEPFHQLDNSTTRKYRGTGLGLTLVKQIVEAHGSYIRVESQLGLGSRFEFSLASSWL
jgi:signal transduction histidine kinase